MVRYLGPSPSVNTILDKLDSLHGSMSTFDVMMQGFYRESWEKSESIAHYIVRLEGKPNKIWVKYLNRVSKVETTWYIRDCLFYGLGNPSKMWFMPNLTTSWMITWFQRKPNNRDPTRVREITINMPAAMVEGPKGNVVMAIMIQLEAIKIRPGGMIETRSNTITAWVEDICDMSARAPGMQDL